MTTIIAANIEKVKHRITFACQQSGVDVQSVTLLAVSKTCPVAAIEAALACGQRAFGENYVQEALDKIVRLDSRRQDIEWHMIGPIQSNKTRQIAEHFDWVHSIDRFKIAQRLSDQRPSHLPPLQVCLQVNVSHEDSKSGIAIEELPELAKAVRQLPRLRLRGLMSIPAPAPDLDAQRLPHRQLKALLEQLNRDGMNLDTLSMGMTGDMEAAIMEGSTMVRVGTAIFGAR